jgi:hypothetical protein
MNTHLKETNNGRVNTTTTKEGGGLTSLTTGLNEIVSFLLAGLDFFFYPLLILLLGAGLLAQPLSQAGIPMGLRLVILRG